MDLGSSSNIKDATQKNQDLDDLAVYSPKDKPWNFHRATCDSVAEIYAASSFSRYSERMAECSGYLGFSQSVDDDGVLKLKLKTAFFCRVRHCPVCQWRRSLMWKARFYQAIPEILLKNPSARWLFLTLTVKNCDIKNLKNTLDEMTEAWHRFVKRKEFKPVLGWIRTTEITRGKDGTAHPHFHVLLMCPPSMLSGKNYVKQEVWAKNWGECMKLDYLPVVDIRAVKSKNNAASGSVEFLKDAVAETLKYSVKSDDMVEDENWFLELTRQTFRKRFIASGGLLKNILKVDKEENEDLIHLEEKLTPEEEFEKRQLVFSWFASERKYKKT